VDLDAPITVLEEVDVAAGELPLAQKTDPFIVETFPTTRRVELTQPIKPVCDGDVIGFPRHTDKSSTDGGLSLGTTAKPWVSQIRSGA
jgi:hypothetical protein